MVWGARQVHVGVSQAGSQEQVAGAPTPGTAPENSGSSMEHPSGVTPRCPDSLPLLRVAPRASPRSGGVRPVCPALLAVGLTFLLPERVAAGQWVSPCHKN